MPERTIDSVHDVTEEDVENVYETLQLVRALSDYNKDRDEYKQSFRQEFLTGVEHDLTAMFRQLAVVVAQKREQEIDPRDLMRNMAGEDYE